MRLFVAIEIDEETRHKIAAVQKRLAPKITGPDAVLRWTKIDQIHLTLAFIGPVDPDRAAKIALAGEPPIPIAPFDMAFAGVGVFPPRGAPRVLWLGIGEGGQAVIRVQQIVAERLASAGVELEKRPFHPHVTLARWKSSRGSDGRRAQQAEIGHIAIRTRVAGVTLFESRQSSAGSVYSPICRWRFSPPI